METAVHLILESGRAAVDLVLYILLPIMVVMMAVMKLLEARGVLDGTARLVSPVLRPFGVPGVGAFAILQLLLISFAAPVATLKVMDGSGVDRRRLAATLAMLLAMSQANAAFPLAAVGLNLPVLLATSLVGGLLAASVTYYLLARDADKDPEEDAGGDQGGRSEEDPPRRLLDLLSAGGREGVGIVLDAIPILLLAILLVKILQAAGAISVLEAGLTPVLGGLGIPGIAILPIVTKFLAGGTAMMGIAMNLVQEGSLTAVELNRIAGLIVNPLDLVGVAVLTSAGRRVGAVARPAVAGAAIGILVRAVLHLLLF